ncbi:MULTISPECIES: tetratricopeptide repeat protein [Deefgea]|uniref:Sel1 repeat family protein n=1 Tax=Deefgea chitinilytica TaxID=570276 RepID=A0ABS2CDW9_9NEIS|nr:MULTISPECIES: tetratricopeptide repeat protein [Deefgea]MBM5572315.1 sel1 repeat family protein [Deefgea chitinilytica]MBM9889551.1 sel1 repeat family protein [Deefgea sp. CFH1-16]
MKIKHTLLALLVAGLISTPASAGYDEGVTAYTAKDYTLAFSEFSAAAAKGDAKSQFSLGVMHYENRGIPIDYAQALSWFSKSAEQGYAPAQHNLGIMYNNGEGVKIDYSQAVSWFRKAAQQGHAPAQQSLGLIYYNGEGVKIDYSQAVSWFRKAAEQGHAQAYNTLGVIYYNGQGVPRDVIVAYALINASTVIDGSTANTTSRNNRDALKKGMTFKQISAGQQLSRELLKPSNFLNALDTYLRDT